MWNSCQVLGTLYTLIKKKTGSSRVLSSHWIIERSRLSKKPHKAYLVLRLWKGSVWIPTPNCFPIRRRPSRNVWILHCIIKGSQLLKMFLLEGFYKEPLRVLPEGQVKNPFECTCLVHLVWVWLIVRRKSSFLLEFHVESFQETKCHWRTLFSWVYTSMWWGSALCIRTFPRSSERCVWVHSSNNTVTYGAFNSNYRLRGHFHRAFILYIVSYT